MLRPRRPSLPPVSLVILSILSSSSCGHSRRVANRRAALRSISLLGAMGGLRNPPSSAYTGRLAELSRAPAGSRTKDYAGYGEDGEVQQALQLIRELRPGATLNDADEAVARAVSTLVETGQSASLALQEGGLGRWEGSWRVVYAPHIRTLSASLLGTTFDVTYDIDGQGAIESNVRYSNPVLGSGWLSSAGTVSALNSNTSFVDFDQFWVDVTDAATPPPKPQFDTTPRKLINDIGGVGFLPGFSRFPVLWFDGEICVFKFPPLNVLIATRKERR